VGEARHIVAHLDRALELLSELEAMLDGDVRDELDLKILKPAILGHVHMAAGRVSRARYLAGKLAGEGG